MKRIESYLLVLAAGLLLTGCKAKPIHLGSLNESGTPSEFLATLESRVKDGPVDIKTKQAVQAIQVSVDEEKNTFQVSNNSIFYIDQISFGCEVARKQFVYFTWNSGMTEDNVWSSIRWLVPKTSYSVFSAFHEDLYLLHNSSHDDESLGPSQLAWLIQNYKPHNCMVLDVASDSTEEDPRVKQNAVQPDFIPDTAKKSGPWDKYHTK